jgi:hypothetical protein
MTTTCALDEPLDAEPDVPPDDAPAFEEPVPPPPPAELPAPDTC